MGDSSSGAGKRRVCVDELRCAESFWWFAVSRFATRCTSRSSCWRRFIYCEAFDHRRQVSCRDGVLHRPVADEARPDCQVRALWTHALTFLDEFREMSGFRILFFLFSVSFALWDPEVIATLLQVEAGASGWGCQEAWGDYRCLGGHLLVKQPVLRTRGRHRETRTWISNIQNQSLQVLTPPDSPVLEKCWTHYNVLAVWRLYGLVAFSVPRSSNFARDFNCL